MNDNRQTEDLYLTLGVAHSANHDDIKKAYKSLALKYHPDKCRDKDNPNRFQEINHAYQILSDPIKRQQYDLSRSVTPVDFRVLGSVIYNFLYSYMAKMASSTVTEEVQSQKKQEHEKPPTTTKPKKNPKRNLTLNVSIGLEEIYKKKIKKFKVRVSRLDGSTEYSTIYLSLLEIEEDEYIYEQMGDEYMEDEKVSRGDIIVKVTIPEHDSVKTYSSETLKCLSRVSAYDTYINRDISLYDLYHGVDCEIPYFDEIIHVQRSFDIEGVTDYVFAHIEHGKGLPYCVRENDKDEEMRGTLYIYFRLVLHRDELAQFFS